MLCKMPEDKRGQYSEEIDVEAKSHYDAIERAKTLLTSQYDPLLRPVRVVLRGGFEVRQM